MAFDPVQMMMLMQGVQSFTDNFSAARRGVQPPQQGGGMQEMVPMMAMMQRGQAANAEMELERQKFSAQQQAAQRQTAEDEVAAKHFNVPVEVLRLARQKMGEEYAERLGTQVVGANDRLISGGQQVVGALPEVTPGGSFNRETLQYVKNPAMQADALARGQSGATRVSVSPTAIYGAQQGAFDKKIYDAAGDSYVALQKDAEAARKMADDFKQINAVLGETPTGEGFDEWRLRFSKLANGIGIPVDEKAISSKETALSLVNQFALGARSPDGPLGGLPGSASNQDINFLKAIPPGIETTPEGRMLMADVQEAKAEHKSKKAQAARQYVQGRGGQVDPIELDSFKAAYDKEHPMFGDVEKRWSGKFGQQSQPPGAADVPAHLKKYFAGP